MTCFKMNDMIVNPGNLQAIAMSCDKKENKCDLNINNSITISSVDCYTFRYWNQQEIKSWKACFNYYFILYIFIDAI